MIENLFTDHFFTTAGKFTAMVLTWLTSFVLVTITFVDDFNFKTTILTLVYVAFFHFSTRYCHFSSSFNIPFHSYERSFIIYKYIIPLWVYLCKAFYTFYLRNLSKIKNPSIFLYSIFLYTEEKSLFFLNTFSLNWVDNKGRIYLYIMST